MMVGFVEKINRPFCSVEKLCRNLKTSSRPIPGYSIADIVSPHKVILIYGTMYIWKTAFSAKLL